MNLSAKVDVLRSLGDLELVNPIASNTLNVNK